jgi:hypothetical protein
MKAEKQMTEQQFIAKFKKAGFEMYKTKDVKAKYNALEKIQKLSEVIK